MAEHTAEFCLTMHPYSRRGRILDGDVLVADTCNGIELCDFLFLYKALFSGIYRGQS